MGLLATGMSCLAHVNVRGRRRVPFPPLRTRAFMVVAFVCAWVLLFFVGVFKVWVCVLLVRVGVVCIYVLFIQFAYTVVIF